MGTPESFVSKFTKSDELVQFFAPESLEWLARKTGFIERVRNLTAVGFMRLCAFPSFRESYPTLGQMVSELLGLGVRMSESSLWERFGPGAVSFMREAFAQVLKLDSTAVAAGVGHFTDLIIGDSTTLTLHPKCKDDFKGSGGGASAAGAKLQFTFGLLSAAVHEVELCHKVGSDLGHVFRNIVAGALYMFDLGFFSGANFQAIITGNAYFICRYKYGSILHHPDGRPIPMKVLDRYVRMLKPGQTVSIPLLVFKGKKVPVRLVMTKLPRSIGDEIRRKKLTDKHNKTKNLSAERLEFCDVNAYITNLTAEQMPSESLRKLYGLRWQVEIMFKTWKSGLGLDQVRNVRSEVFQCFLYGGLIRMLLCFRIFWRAKIVFWNSNGIELSEIKGMREVASRIGKINEWLLEGKRSKEELLSEIWLSLTKACVKEAKKGDITPFKIIQYYA